MIFYEKLKLKFDIGAMNEEVALVQNLGERVSQGSFGGWSLQSDNDDWRRGFEQGGYYENTNNERYTRGEPIPPYQYDKKTEACTGIFSDIIDELEEKGFNPCRARITVLDPGQTTSVHADSLAENYSVRIHIPFITNPDCRFIVSDVGSVHMPADGHAWLVDVATMHQAVNYGNCILKHFLAQM